MSKERVSFAILATTLLASIVAYFWIAIHLRDSKIFPAADKALLVSLACIPVLGFAILRSQWRLGSVSLLIFILPIGAIIWKDSVRSKNQEKIDLERITTELIKLQAESIETLTCTDGSKVLAHEKGRKTLFRITAAQNEPARILCIELDLKNPQLCHGLKETLKSSTLDCSNTRYKSLDSLMASFFKSERT
jgi:hypothetical protein